MKDGYGAGLLMREKDGKYYAATGSKGYRWMESEMVKELEKKMALIGLITTSWSMKLWKPSPSMAILSGLYRMILIFQNLVLMTPTLIVRHGRQNGKILVEIKKSEDA